MEQFVNFAINHWLLWLAFFIILGLLIWFEVRTQVGGVTKLTPNQVVPKMNHEFAALWDVREKSSFATGHILGAINLPAKDITSDTVQKKLKRNKNKPIILVGGSDQQALKIGTTLIQQGLPKVFILKGGIGAWRGANLPLVQEKN